VTKNKLTVILAIIFSAIFITLFSLQYFLFYGSSPTFPQKIEKVMEYCKKSDWKNANTTLIDLEKTWSDGQDIIAIKYADQQYTFLQMELLRLRKSIESQDSKEAISEGAICLLLFENITSIAPKP